MSIWNAGTGLITIERQHFSNTDARKTRNVPATISAGSLKQHSQGGPRLAKLSFRAALARTHQENCESADQSPNAERIHHAAVWIGLDLLFALRL